ncbi:MAG: SMP-30/gluconolactonase/LRE family protein [Bacteroidota bacterium]
MKKVYTLLLAVGAIVSTAMAQDKPLFDTLVKPQLISKQFKFTEGPAVDKKGNIFFTDQPNNKIWKYDTNGQLSIFMDNAGRSNGMFFDKKGNLISCADENDQLWSIDKDGKATVLVKDLGGHLLNGPNDVWVNNKTGSIYFTDPYYQRDYWTRKKSDLDGQKVYYMAKGGVPVAVEDQLKKPNGIVGTPDGKILYVADIQANKIYKYSIAADGTLKDKQLLINQGSDGMTLDEQGNIYLCGKGVTIYDPTGKKLAHIDIPEPWTANICFGGKDRKLLFMTASTAVYTLRMNVKGVE